MKTKKLKLALSILAMMLTASTASAQDIVQDYETDKSISISSSSMSPAQEDNTPQINMGFGIDYLAVEKATGVGIHYVIKNVGVGVSFIFGETEGEISSNIIGRVDIGYNPQYWFNKNFFVEGYIGVGYWSGTISGHDPYNNVHFEENTKCGFLTMTPRIGLAVNIGKGGLALKAGYRWDFTKFKFKKENQADYFTIGLVWFWEE